MSNIEQHPFSDPDGKYYIASNAVMLAEMADGDVTVIRSLIVSHEDLGLPKTLRVNRATLDSLRALAVKDRNVIEVTETAYNALGHFDILVIMRGGDKVELSDLCEFVIFPMESVDAELSESVQ
jgi:hypothetical protein